MKRPSFSSAFTLIEMITVMAVIAILASLVLAVNSFVQKKSSTTKANAEIATISSAIANYKADNGSVPRDNDSDSLNPRTHGSPASGDRDKYKKACLVLYKAISGDADPLDGRTDTDAKNYAPEFFKPANLKMETSTGSNKKPEYIQDPFGNCYGYSTMGIKAEEEFREKVKSGDRTAKREAEKGFNPTFDMWSTGGTNVSGTSLEEARKRWIKNW